MAKTRNFSRFIKTQLADDPELRAEVEREIFSSKVAEEVFDARQRVGLTQKQLAERAGTKQPVIARLEDADYKGHSLSMLWRIADALGCELLVKLQPRYEAETASFETAPAPAPEWNKTSDLTQEWPVLQGGDIGYEEVGV